MMGREEIIKGVAVKLAPRFGLSGTAIAFGITTALSLGAAVYQNVTRFDKGYEAAIDGMREGRVELDGVVIEIKTETDKASLRSYELMKKAEQNYNQTDTAAVESLRSNVAYWKQQAQQKQKDRNNDPQTPWDDSELPSHERLRFNKLNRERASDGSADTGASVNSQSRALGYPTIDALAGPPGK